MSGGRAPETAPAEAPPTRAGSAHHRHRLQGGTGRRSPAGTVGGLFQHRRSGQGRQMATREAGPDAGRRRRLAGSPRRRVLRARYQDYTQSINGPPIVPPGPCKPSPAILQNHRRRDRQQAAEEARGTTQQTDSHTAPAPPPAQPASRPTATANTNHRQRRGTADRQNRRPNRHAATASGPTITTGQARRAVGTPGGSSTSAGAEAQNIFRCVSIFFTSPGPGRKNKRGVKKKNWRPLEGRQKIF